MDHGAGLLHLIVQRSATSHTPLPRKTKPETQLDRACGPRGPTRASRQLRRLRPTQRALIVSGYAPDQTTRMANELGVDSLAKPYTPNSLASCADGPGRHRILKSGRLRRSRPAAAEAGEPDLSSR